MYSMAEMQPIPQNAVLLLACVSLCIKSVSFQCLTEWQLCSADCGHNFCSLPGALRISSTTGNAGTGGASEAQAEHGCEFAPVATTM